MLTQTPQQSVAINILGQKFGLNITRKVYIKNLTSHHYVGCCNKGNVTVYRNAKKIPIDTHNMLKSAFPFCGNKLGVYLLHDVIFPVASSNMKQGVSTHVDDVDASPTIDKHIHNTSVAVYGCVVHGSEPMLVPTMEQQQIDCSVCITYGMNALKCRTLGAISCVIMFVDIHSLLASFSCSNACFVLSV